MNLYHLQAYPLTIIIFCLEETYGNNILFCKWNVRSGPPASKLEQNSLYYQGILLLILAYLQHIPCTQVKFEKDLQKNMRCFKYELETPLALVDQWELPRPMGLISLMRKKFGRRNLEQNFEKNTWHIFRRSVNYIYICSDSQQKSDCREEKKAFTSRLLKTNYDQAQVKAQ